MADDTDCWSYSAGEYGNTVYVFERHPGSNLYIRVPDGRGGYTKKTLGHRDQSKAKSAADRAAAQLREGEEAVRTGSVSIHRIFRLYRRFRSPRKREKGQQSDERRVELWERCLGAETSPYRITLRDWESFQDARKSGRIDARGKLVRDEDKRTPVAWSTVRMDLRWLVTVLNWARDWQTDSGSYLLSENPVRGYDLPDVKNQSRPVATRERYESLREAGENHEMRLYRDGSATYERSWFVEMLDLAVHTGRRIGAICGLRRSHLEMDRTSLRPHGGITWPGETDKMGKEWTAALHPEAREAIDRQLARVDVIGKAPVFPACKDASKPLPTRTAHKWMRKVEGLAEVEHYPGDLWHPFRRMWASERRHLPDVDVAQAGGWSSPDVMRESYQHADEATQYNVVTDTRERRRSGPKTG